MAKGSSSGSRLFRPNWLRSKLMLPWATGTPHALAAMQGTRTLPIIFVGAGDPVTDGLVTSLARPGGNVTGLSNLAPELVGKRLELLTQAVAVLWQPGSGGERTEKDLLRIQTA